VANHFFAARKGDVFIKKWHDYFCYLWRDRTNATGIASNHHLLKVIMSNSNEAAWGAGFRWKWDAPPQQIMEYIAQIQAWNVVALADQPPPDAFDGLEYFNEHVLKFDALTEDWPAETIVGWEGKDLFDLFSTPLDADPGSEAHKKAYEVVWKMLTTASMQKITRGGGLSDGDHFGTLLDKWVKDEQAPRTFFDLLRHGSVHFEQVGRSMRLNGPYEGEVVIKESLIPA
jgi:hypothetical protein